MNPIVSISHFQQSAEGYCLSACVRMVLTHLGLERSEAEVSQMLLSPCHCEERFLRRSNLLLAAWGLLRSARNDSLSRSARCSVHESSARRALPSVG